AIYEKTSAPARRLDPTPGPARRSSGTPSGWPGRPAPSSGRLPDVHLASAASTLEPRQRWRLVFRRGVEACELVHKEVVERWAAAILASGLPVALTEAQPPRPRLAFAAPVPAGMMAGRGVVDLLLRRRLPMGGAPTAAVPRLPAG